MPPLWFLQQLEDRKQRRDRAHFPISRPSTAPQPSPLARQAAMNSARQAAGPSIGQYNIPSSGQDQYRPSRGTQSTTPLKAGANTGAPRANQHTPPSTSQNVVPGTTVVTASQNTAHRPIITSATDPSTIQLPSSQPQPQSQPPTLSKSHHKKVDSGAHVFPSPTASSITRPVYNNSDIHPDNPFRDPTPPSSAHADPSRPLLDRGEEGPVEQGPRLLEPFYKSMWKKMKKSVQRRKEKRNRDRSGGGGKVRRGERPNEIHDDAHFSYVEMRN